MTKAAFVRARIEPQLKSTAEHILDQLGITPTQAVTMLYKRIANEHGWPVELKIPSTKTRKAMEETDKKIGLVKCKNADDLLKKIGINKRRK